MSERVESLLVDLVMAIRAQTEAINQLVISNMALVDAMTEAVEDEGGNEVARVYLDGKPR